MNNKLNNGSAKQTEIHIPRTKVIASGSVKDTRVIEHSPEELRTMTYNELLVVEDLVKELIAIQKETLSLFRTLSNRGK